ncbi:MAG TPA: hypothetical protein DCY97_10290 [Marinilabiliales bacterium]|jgi:site-specific recombinase XerD|nr:hypothetical protein [Marinilabiliales bacterium]
MEVNGVLEQSFKKWLHTLGYAESTVYASTHYVRDFFKWLESQEIKELNQITKPTIKSYHNHLQTRKNKRQSGSLSQNSITGNINALKRLSRYLQETGKAIIEIDLQLPAAQGQTLNVLTQTEVQKLYHACGDSTLGKRDKALLDIYYGCGLRRSEGINLDLSDILLKEKLVHVRSGKGYKERYVPITETLKESLANYINTARKELLESNNQKETAFFLGVTGKRPCGVTAITRVQQLAKAANLDKTIGLHTLRHSIATHLLQSGMGLENVSRFLGHSSLESTQIYTHLKHEV